MQRELCLEIHYPFVVCVPHLAQSEWPEPQRILGDCAGRGAGIAGIAGACKHQWPGNVSNEVSPPTQRYSLASGFQKFFIDLVTVKLLYPTVAWRPNFRNTFPEILKQYSELALLSNPLQNKREGCDNMEINLHDSGDREI